MVKENDTKTPAMPVQTVSLRDGSELAMHTFIAPIEASVRRELKAVLQSEWADGDLHWDATMAGEYADSLTMVTCAGMRNGRMAGTATTAYAAQEMEVGVVCDVVTLAEFRGLGIARAVTQVVTDHFFSQGGRALYLGTGREESAGRVYQRVGFEWFHGGVMRNLPAQSADFDDDYFAPGQATSIRGAQWGDMPGVTALFTRPYEALAGDYGRGMFSSRYADQGRCVSNFPHIYYDVTDKQGSCQVLIGETAHRVLGLASITPIDGAPRRHVGQLEIMTHEAHHEHGPALLQATAKAGQALGMRRAVAYVPTMDAAKRQWMRQAGAEEVGILHGQVQLKDQSVDVEMFESELAGMVT